MKYKHASQICISVNFFIKNNCIITRTLKIKLELNNYIHHNSENFRKNNQNSEEPICKFLEPENKYKLLKNTSFVQTRFLNRDQLIFLKCLFNSYRNSNKKLEL